jgi:hypothetical protein
MSVLIPSSKLDASQATAMRSDLRQATQAAVIGTMQQGTVVRDLQAYDISGAAPAAARYARLSNVGALVAATWLVKDLSRQIPQNTAIGVYGYVVLAAAPIVDAIRFTLSGAPYQQFNLQELYADLYAKIGYMDSPMLFLPGQIMGIDLLSEVGGAGAAEKYGLLGYVAEPGGFSVLGDAQRLA